MRMKILFYKIMGYAQKDLMKANEMLKLGVGRAWRYHVSVREFEDREKLEELEMKYMKIIFLSLGFILSSIVFVELILPFCLNEDYILKNERINYIRRIILGKAEISSKQVWLFTVQGWLVISLAGTWILGCFLPWLLSKKQAREILAIQKSIKEEEQTIEKIYKVIRVLFVILIFWFAYDKNLFYWIL